MIKDTQDSGITYLPERYKRQIEAKKRRRAIKKIVIICAAIVTCAVLFLVLGGMQLPIPGQNPLLFPGSSGFSPDISTTTPPGQFSTNFTYTVTTTEYPDMIIDKDVPAQPGDDMLSVNNATIFLRQDYPAAEYTLIRVNATDRYPDLNLYEFRIKRINTLPGDTGFSVFIDARTGNSYTPGQENAKITADQAKTLAKESFFGLQPDSIRIRYNNSSDSVRSWIFSLYRDTAKILTGSIDPDTGEIVSFSRIIPTEGRQSDPLVDINAAQKIADRYIIEKNSAPLPLNMSDASYLPLGSSQNKVAGQYVFLYNRIVQEIPCDNDGFTISVDSVSGEVTGYERRWTTPESAFSVVADPLITRYEATFVVLKKAQEIYPSSGDGIRIVSAEIRWKDTHSPGSIPRPGSIPTAWKLQFTDAIIREQQTPVPAVGWVDAQTGKILAFYYQH